MITLVIIGVALALFLPLVLGVGNAKGEQKMTIFIKTGLGLAIAVIFPLMVGLGIEAFYPSPTDPYQKCIDLLPAYNEKTQINPDQDPKYRACTEAQKKIVNEHNRNVFAITVLIGFVALAAGSLLYREEIAPVMPGLVFGGIITIFYGTVRGFEAVDKRWLFLELVVLLLGVIGVTWRYLHITDRDETARKNQKSKVKKTLI